MHLCITFMNRVVVKLLHAPCSRYYLHMAQTQNPEVKQLIKIEHKLEEIKDRTGNTKHAFFYGLLQGAGAVVGGIAAIILLGWLLSIIGIIPGFGDLAAYLREAVGTWRGIR